MPARGDTARRGGGWVCSCASATLSQNVEPNSLDKRWHVFSAVPIEMFFQKFIQYMLVESLRVPGMKTSGTIPARSGFVAALFPLASPRVSIFVPCHFGT